ncbi:hypothetical protein [Microbacterium sp. NPDC078849]|uniref:hypothetical protein n=1 Tax=unclassified Microbacterium TaxID=2609290 RepID=UPI00344DF300
MSTDPIVPAAVRLAAKRAFVRTTYQAYAATLAAGISVTVVLGIVTGQIDVVATAVQFGVALAAPPLAGLVAWLNVTSNGIPKDYVDVALVEQAFATDEDARDRVQTAVQRVSLRRDRR